VLSEPEISQIQQLRQAGEARQKDQRAQTDGGIQPPKDLYALKPLAGSISSPNSSHKLILTAAVISRSKALSSDIRELNSFLPIQGL